MIMILGTKSTIMNVLVKQSTPATIEILHINMTRNL